MLVGILYNEDTFTDSALEKKIMYKRIDTKVQLHTHTKRKKEKYSRSCVER